MNAKIAFKLLAQLLTRILVLHVLRKLDGARPTPGKLPAVRILGLINVLLAPDSAAISEVRSELEASRITFKVEIDSPNELVGYIGDIPRMRIELGQGSTLYLTIQAADAVLVFRAGQMKEPAGQFRAGSRFLQRSSKVSKKTAAVRQLGRLGVKPASFV